jgi:hypothetical protein
MAYQTQAAGYRFILCPGCGAKLGLPSGIRCELLACRAPCIECEEKCRNGMEDLYFDGNVEVVKEDFCTTCQREFGNSLGFPQDWVPTPSPLGT